LDFVQGCFTRMKKLQLIDLTRSFCILTVLGLHAGVILNEPTHSWSRWCWDHFQQNGMYGVCLFFGISGFLITGVIANGSAGLYQPNFKQFYVQRAGRILPLLVLVIWIGYCMLAIPQDPHASYLDIFHPPSGHLGFAFWFCVVTLTFNWFRAIVPSAPTCIYWSILWSLCVEEQFYLLFPASLKKAGNEKNLYRILFGVIILCFFWRTGCCFWAPSRLVQLCTSFGAFDCIAIGVLLYLVNERLKKYLSQNRKMSALICVVGLVLLLLVYFFADFNPVEVIFAPSFLNLGLALFLLGGMRLDFFESRWLKLFALPGKYCYGSYLLHLLILSVGYPILLHMDAWKGFAVYSLVTTLIAAASFHFFEMPANRLIRSTFLKTTKDSLA
jgi:peptidoglycan/LPS O-acetylase OafA/YrhL